MDIRQLKYFVAVAETGVISRAAARCRVAQPSISQQLKSLEQQMGCRLFDRLPRGVALTDAGRALLPRARRILSEINAARGAIQDDIATGRAALHVGAIPTMAPYLLPPLVKTFMRRYPQCELSLREDLTDRLVEALVDHEIDMAIMSTPIENELIQLEVVGREQLLLVAAVNYELHAKTPSPSVSDLRDEPAVVLHEMHCLGQQIDAFCGRRKLTRRIVCRSTQLHTILRLVELGLGISFVPEMCARADKSKLRTYRSLGKTGPAREIAIAYHVDRTRSHLAREFGRMLRGELGKHRYEAGR